MRTTILFEDREAAEVAATIAGESIRLEPAALVAATGWKLEPRGLCRGEACVPLPTGEGWVDAEGRIDLAAFARHMGQPIARDHEHAAFAFGASADRRRASLASLEAPDFTLPDLDGVEHKLSEYRGKKILLFSWGSY